MESRELFESIRQISSQNNMISTEELEATDYGNCPICYEEIKLITYDDKEKKIKPNTNTTTTPCGHTFCFDCLSKHLEKNIKCPICRKKISNKQRIKPLTTYEGCFVINQKFEQHLGRFDTMLLSSEELRDNSILIGSIKYCMYDMMQAFRRFQYDVESDDEL